MSATQLTNDILASLSRGDTRFFRVNAGGIAWQGTVLERSGNRLVLGYPRQIHLAPAGYPDLSGWSGHEGLAIFTGIEVKDGKDRVRPEQAAFIELVRKSGGRAGVARSVEEAYAITRAPLQLQYR